MPKVDFSQTFRVPTSVTAEDVARWLRSVPPLARITVEVSPGDRPFDPGESRIVARWTGDVDD